MRTKERTDSELPTWKKSSTDSDDPMQVMP
jgi:hypothetical protein